MLTSYVYKKQNFILNSLSLKHYSSYLFKNASDSHRSGAVSTFVHNSIPHSVVPLNTSLQAQAILVTLDNHHM